MTELVLPQHSNVLGTAFGGTVLAWMDVCGAVSAQRHSGCVSVTASMDDVNFVSPIRIGDVVIVTGRVTAAFRTSVEVEVQVQVEDRASGARRRCVEAYMTFVAVDAAGKPCEQPPLALETADDERRASDAKARREARLAKRA
jgi:acyl-CoA hydrolase